MRKSIYNTCLQAIFCGLSLFPTIAFSNTYPSTDTVTLMVPYPAGGPSDSIARVLSGPIGQHLGAQIIVENLGGATGSIAANKVLKAKADGNYFFQGTANELILPPLTNSAINFKPSDFRAVHFVTTSNLVLLVKQDLPANSVDEFIQLAKQRSSSNPLTYGSVGIGSLYHLITDRIAKTLDSTLIHIPYKGTSNVIQDLAGGQLDFTIQAFSKNMKEMEKSGRYKILAVLSKEKPEILRDYPSLSETNIFKDFNYTTGSAYFVKKETPDFIVEKLNHAIAKALQSPEVKASLEADGRTMAKSMSYAEANDLYQAEIKRIEDVIKLTGFVGN